jgi:hypothetical protein
VLTQHPAYASLMKRVLGAFTDPERAKGQSTAEQIAEVVFEAATDDKDQVTYVAGVDAKALYAQRLAAGAEAFRKEIAKVFMG